MSMNINSEIRIEGLGIAKSELCMIPIPSKLYCIAPRPRRKRLVNLKAVVVVKITWLMARVKTHF